MEVRDHKQVSRDGVHPAGVLTCSYQPRSNPNPAQNSSERQAIELHTSHGGHTTHLEGHASRPKESQAGWLGLVWKIRREAAMMDIETSTITRNEIHGFMMIITHEVKRG